MIWQGKFVDPSGVWRGQGHGNVRPMSRPVDLAKGPELDDHSKPWLIDEGRPPDHQFLGYSLDQLRRPTFKYRFEQVEVSDFFTQVVNKENGKVVLRRTVSFASEKPRNGLRFRIADDQDMTKKADGNYQIGKRLTIRIESEHDVEVVDGSDGKQLQVSFNLAAAAPQKLIIEYLLD